MQQYNNFEKVQIQPNKIPVFFFFFFWMKHKKTGHIKIKNFFFPYLKRKKDPYLKSPDSDSQ